MKKLVIFAIVAVLAAPAFAGEFFERAGEKVADEYLCTFAPGTNARGAASELAGKHGVTTKGTFNALNVAHFVTKNQKRIVALAQNPNVLFCEPNMIARVDGSQSSAPWGVDRVDQRNLPLNGTYNWNYDGSNVDAWILDTGVRTTHNDFGGRASDGYVNCNGYGSVDGHGHGTHVAGSAGGATYGVAKNVTIKSIKVCSDAGSCPTSATSCGLNYVTNNASGDSVGNFSIGGGFSQTSNNNMAAPIAAGVFFAVAAGNAGGDACNYSPASEPTAYTVGCSRSNDASCGYNGGSCVDIVAPGYQILSAWYTGNNATATISGTSMSSPHVAGAAALVLEENPGWSPAQVDAELDARATTGVLTGQMAGTPDRLLYTLGGSPPPACSTNADCDDGLFCNGAETCNAGSCQAGSNPCSGGDVCNESTDTCDPPPACSGTLYSGTTSGSNLVTNNGGCNASGTFTGDMTCTGSVVADLDLFLQRYTCGWGCSWSNAASSTSAGCDESINTSGQSSGEYRWLVDHYSGGNQSFDLCVNKC